MKRIGVLGLQGAIEEHQNVVNQLGYDCILVKTEEELNQVDAIILPGGESTSMGKQLDWFGLLQPLCKKIKEDKLPVFGTCAGMILLAKEIESYQNQIRIGAMDIAVKRNAYGSQLDSFISEIDVKGIENKVPAVFIRAPRIETLSSNVEVLSSWDSHPILVKQENMMAASFHPELTQDYSIHKLFIDSF